MCANMPRPIILGIVGDSASGKTTLSKGLVRLLGEDVVTHICTDDYHKYDRKQRAERAITPLNPDCNYLDIMAAHLNDLRAGSPILKPVYQHKDGTFGPLVYVEPDPFAVVEGLLGYYTPEMREAYDVRVYLDPPESLRRKWKVDRDCAKRGYTTDQVLDDLDRREPDSAAYIRPQRAHADMVVCRQPNPDDPFVLDAVLTLRDSLPHPDLSPFVDGEVLTMSKGAGRRSRPEHPRRARARARGGDRGGDLGQHALRQPPALGHARRVHRRQRHPPLGVARARAAADPLPPDDGARDRRRSGESRATASRPGGERAPPFSASS